MLEGAECRRVWAWTREVNPWNGVAHNAALPPIIYIAHSAMLERVICDDGRTVMISLCSLTWSTQKAIDGAEALCFRESNIPVACGHELLLREFTAAKAQAVFDGSDFGQPHLSISVFWFTDLSAAFDHVVLEPHACSVTCAQYLESCVESVTKLLNDSLAHTDRDTHAHRQISTHLRKAICPSLALSVAGDCCSWSSMAASSKCFARITRLDVARSVGKLRVARSHTLCEG